ncbi:MAG: RNA ligase family protein [Trueperaceae bacterium]
MLPFTSYQKIAETTQDWQLEHPKQLNKVSWCVTEKVHGANFCLIQSKNKLQAAKRKAVLSEGEEFFGYQRIKEHLATPLKELFGLLESQTSFTHLYVFGGACPHPDVKPMSSIQVVQTGVYYTPTLAFIAFDLAVSNGSEIKYWDYENVIELFKQVNLFYAEPLFVGLLTEALEFNERFNTTIPRRLGLPELTNNFAEGVVIKPMQETLVKTSKGFTRPILKKKIAEFAEDERFHQAEKQKPQVHKVHVLNILEYEFYQLVNVNRVQSAIFKVGELKTHEKEIKRLIAEDVWESLSDKYGDKVKDLCSEDRDLLELILQELVDEAVRSREDFL